MGTKFNHTVEAGKRTFGRASLFLLLYFTFKFTQGRFRVDAVSGIGSIGNEEKAAITALLFSKSIYPEGIVSVFFEIDNYKCNHNNKKRAK